jgi:hypothetical protein
VYEKEEAAEGTGVPGNTMVLLEYLNDNDLWDGGFAPPRSIKLAVELVESAIAEGRVTHAAYRVRRAPVDVTVAGRIRARFARLKAGQPPPIPRACLCGCGQMTKGGIFWPGHDARVYGWLKKAKVEGWQYPCALDTWNEILAAAKTGRIKPH